MELNVNCDIGKRKRTRNSPRSGEFDDEEAGDAAVSYRKLICFRVFVVSFHNIQ